MFMLENGWKDYFHLFSGNTVPFSGELGGLINIVCAPPNLLLGSVFKVEGSEVYKPQTALSGCWTAGTRNIAITEIKPKAPEPNEVEALKKYDLVLCPTEEDTRVLQELGVRAIHVPPDEKLRELFSVMEVITVAKKFSKCMFDVLGETE
jgi:hypothetical protein